MYTKLSPITIPVNPGHFKKKYNPPCGAENFDDFLIKLGGSFGLSNFFLKTERIHFCFFSTKLAQSAKIFFTFCPC